MKASEFLNRVTDVAEQLLEISKMANTLSEKIEEVTEYLGKTLVELKSTIDNLEREYKKLLT